MIIRLAKKRRQWDGCLSENEDHWVLHIRNSRTLLHWTRIETVERELSSQWPCTKRKPAAVFEIVGWNLSRLILFNGVCVSKRCRTSFVATKTKTLISLYTKQISNSDFSEKNGTKRFHVSHCRIAVHFVYPLNRMNNINSSDAVMQ